VVSSPVVYLDKGLTITGSGFRSFESIEVVFDLGIQQPSLGFVISDPAGAWVLKAPKLDQLRSIKNISRKLTVAPVLTLLAHGVDGSKATTPVVAVAESPPIKVVAPPSVAASLVAGTVEEGGTITVTLAGFKPNEVISFFVTTGATTGNLPVRAQLGGSKAAPTGAGTKDIKIGTLEPGVYTIEAVGINGTLATAALVVVSEK
jgi:hypothetical protein